MAIGILALIIGVIFALVGAAGAIAVQPPVREEKEVRFPYPKEI